MIPFDSTKFIDLNMTLFVYQFGRPSTVNVFCDMFRTC